jgi:ankyrin repeat protein
LESARTEIARGVNLNESFNHWDRRTPLGLAAASKGCGVDMLALLLDRGADLSAGEPPLFLAAKEGAFEKVKFLVDRGAPASHRDQNGYNAVLHASLSWAPEALEIIQFLVERGCDPTNVTKYSESAVGNALSLGRLDIARWLLANGGAPVGVGWTDQFTAIVLGEGGKLTSDLKHPPAITTGSWCALHLAAIADALPVLQAMDDQGLDIFAKDHVGRCALDYAASGDAVAACEWLVRKGFDVNRRQDYGQTPLFESVGNGQIGTTRFLLENGADPNRRNHVNENAIHRAWKAEIVVLLAAFGAEIDNVGGQGYSPLMFAAEDGRADLVRLYLSLGANPDATSHGATALHYAVRMDEEETVKVLLAAGCDVNAMDVDDETALQHCNSDQMKELLLDHGATW